MAQVRFRQAIALALADEMRKDPSVMVFGERAQNLAQLSVQLHLMQFKIRLALSHRFSMTMTLVYQR